VGNLPAPIKILLFELATNPCYARAFAPQGIIRSGGLCIKAHCNAILTEKIRKKINNKVNVNDKRANYIDFP